MTKKKVKIDGERRMVRFNAIGQPMDDDYFDDVKTYVTGPGEAIHQYPPRGKGEIHRFRVQTMGGTFHVKVNLAGVNGSQILGAAAPYGLAFAFTIGDLTGVNFGALFDQFRISRIRLRVSHSQNTNATGKGSLLYIVRDYDNSTLLTSAAQAESYGDRCRMIRGSDVGEGESYYCDIVPSSLSPVLSGNRVVTPKWEDLAVTTGNHYGFKLWYQTAALTDPVWDVDAEYEVECINTI
jgi:hypothetical protein